MTAYQPISINPPGHYDSMKSLTDFVEKMKRMDMPDHPAVRASIRSVERELEARKKPGVKKWWMED